MDFPYTLHIIGIIILVLLSTWLDRAFENTRFFARKLLHIGAIGAVAHATYITEESFLTLFVWLIFSAATLLTLAVLGGFFQIDGRKSWGIAYFPWVLWLLLLCFPEQKHNIAISFGILAVSDGLSAIAGRFIRLKTFWGYSNQTINGKTWIGYGVFVLTAWTFLMVVFWNQLHLKNDGASLFNSLLTLFILALSTAMVELLSGNGADNISVPLWCFFILIKLKQLSFLIWAGSAFILPIMCIAIWVVWKKWLSMDGLFAAILLAILVLLAGIDIIPLVIFFVLGSVASKLNTTQKSDHKQGKARDRWQVAANGGIIGILALLNVWGLNAHIMGPSDMNFFVFVVMAAALGDTLSSELGIRWGNNPRSILTWKQVPIGLSGGVTGFGLLGAFLGGLIMAAYSYVHYEIQWETTGFIALSGLLGSLIDSLLGDSVQEKFERQGNLSDIGVAADRVRGVAGVTNDAVNLISLFLVLAIAWLWAVFILT